MTFKNAPSKRSVMVWVYKTDKIQDVGKMLQIYLTVYIITVFIYIFYALNSILLSFKAFLAFDH